MTTYIDTQVYINLAIVISKQKLSLSVLALILNSSRNIVVVASVVVLKCGSRDDAKVAKKNTNRYIHMYYIATHFEDNILN